MPPYRIGLKLWSINTDYYFEEARRLYSEGVYDYIELYVVPGSLSFLPQWGSLDIPYIIHHPHFAHGFNLAKAEKEKTNREIYGEVKQFADALRAPHIIFHGGIDGCVEETARQLAALEEARALIENKPFVALPNRMGGEFCRGATPEELQHIISTAKCGFCFDVGHAVCAANSLLREPYAYLQELNALRPQMYHLSDVADMSSPYDAHPHLGTGKLDIARLKKELFVPGATISVETNKNSKTELNDFKEDCLWLRRC